MQLLRILSGVIVVYTIILFLRILLTWFRGDFYGRSWELLHRITDPYLNLFSGLSFLRRGMFDFTPLVAILVLVVALNFLNGVMRYGRLTLGLFLGSAIGALWSGLAFFLLIFLILSIIRAIILATRGETETYFARAVRLMLQPVINTVVRYLPIRRPLSELQYLYLTIAILFLIRALGGILIRYTVAYFNTLPI